MGGRTAAASLVALAVAGCGNSGSNRQDDSRSESRRASSADAVVPDRALDARIRFDAVGMPAKIASANDFEVDRKALALALDAARPAIVACYMGRPLAQDSVDGPAATWVTARVSDRGEPTAVTVARSNAPDASTKCATDVLTKIAFGGSPQPFALGVWLDVAPKDPSIPSTPSAAPASSAAESAAPWKTLEERAGLVAGSCAPDSVLAYLPICAQPAAPAPADSSGDMFGAGGLGLSGAGGIGLSSIGGFGSRGSGVSSRGRSAPPKVRMLGTTVSGRLPPEVIQRIVRSHFGSFRLCYENGLRSDPTLEGKVAVSFVIQADGSVSTLSHTTTMTDAATALCVERAFSSLSFPQPEGGVVKVTYPIQFTPGDTVRKKANAILGIDQDKLTGANLAKAATRDRAFAASVEGDPTADVPFVVFVDVQGDHFAVVRVPTGSSATPRGSGLYGEAFNLFVQPAGGAKATTAFLE